MRRVGRPSVGTSRGPLIAIRIDPEVLAGLKCQPRRQATGYQTLISEILAEHSRIFSNPNGTAPDAGAAGSLIVTGNTFSRPIPITLQFGFYQVWVIGRLPSGQLVGTFSDAITLILP